MLPDFFILGAQRSGTTSLWEYLREHPDVYMSPVKEPDYFAPARAVTGPPALVGSPRPALRRGEYEALFAGARGEAAVGEASPSYLYVEESCARIRKQIPEARGIVILRDPAERAYSHYRHSVLIGREEVTSDFRAALAAEDERIAAGWHRCCHYRRRGFYFEQVRRYFDAWGRERVHVALFDDLARDAAGVVREVFRFLGVDEDFVPQVTARHAAAGVSRSRLAGKLFRLGRRLAQPAKRWLPYAVRRRLKGALVARRSLDPELRSELVAGYRDDVERLQELLGRDLSGWLEVERGAAPGPVAAQ